MRNKKSRIFAGLSAAIIVCIMLTAAMLPTAAEDLGRGSVTPYPYDNSSGGNGIGGRIGDNYNSFSAGGAGGGVASDSGAGTGSGYDDGNDYGYGSEAAGTDNAGMHARDNGGRMNDADMNEDGEVLGENDAENSATVGIVIAILIAVAIIVLIIALLPRGTAGV